MTVRFEENVRQAFASFMAETERNVIAELRAAFARMSTDAVVGARAPRIESPALDPRPHRRAPASHRAPAPTSGSADLAALRKQLIGCVHDSPGCTTAELGQRLGLHTAKIRRQLMRLQADGALRWEERPSGFGRQQCRAYFLGQREVAHVTNVIDQPHGAQSGAPGAALGESP